MEGSKTFSKDFMARHNIPTAAYGNFSDYAAAKAYLESVNHKAVIKASGLAAGKGVIIPETKEEGLAALKEIMEDKIFGEAGEEVVIEEFLEGQELSILGFSDGYTIVALPPAQDHKRIFDGDKGPNTGGMGCYAPTPKAIAPQTLLDEIHKTILQPTIDGFRKERIPFIGMLFTGIMLTPNGPKVLEYNVRFGDPETQTVLPLLSADTDLAEIMLSCAGGYLDTVKITVEDKFSATVVVAAGGYPGSYPKGDEITLTTPAADTTIFHAGTAFKDNKVLTAGGRVIAANATAATLEEAVKKAYEGVSTISFDKMFFRKDIAHRALSLPVSTKKSALTYAEAGVSITAGNDLVHRIKSAVKSTKRPGADAEIGGFGGTFDLPAAGYEGPILLGAIDGVGTKLKIAQAVGKHDTVGIDLVAMNVNDLVVQGAEPLFFLDCYSTSALDTEVATSFVEGVAHGCRLAGCALIGGETAEMPGMYQDGEYDAVGAAVGAVHRERLLPLTDSMKAGDVLVGIASSGVHSNGFSLVRKIIEREGLSFSDPSPWAAGLSVGEALLEPTKVYVKSLLALCKKDLLKGMSHITGGGLTENIPRMLPDSLKAEIEIGSWEVPAVFRWLKKAGGVENAEFARTWNVGLGMVVVVEESKVEEVFKGLEGAGERAWVVGKLAEKKTEEEGVDLLNLGKWDSL